VDNFPEQGVFEGRLPEDRGWVHEDDRPTEQGEKVISIGTEHHLIYCGFDSENSAPILL
jgi:hypothetical protein